MTEQLREKIKKSANKIDDLLNFVKIAQKIPNKALRWIVSAFELVDGTLFKLALQEVADILPEKALPVMEGFLDAFNAEDYLLLVDSAGEFLAELNLVKLTSVSNQKNVYVALLTFMVRLIPQHNEEELPT
jgi:hypothetical protein